MATATRDAALRQQLWDARLLHQVTAAVASYVKQPSRPLSGTAGGLVSGPMLESTLARSIWLMRTAAALVDAFAAGAPPHLLRL